MLVSVSTWLVCLAHPSLVLSVGIGVVWLICMCSLGEKRMCGESAQEIMQARNAERAAAREEDRRLRLEEKKRRKV
jgi:hypothetical protein